MASIRLVAMGLAAVIALPGGHQKTVADIQLEIGQLRATPDAKRGTFTRQIAMEIRQLPAGATKLGLASGLANLSTEGDFGRVALQAVATTLADSLAGLANSDRKSAHSSYLELAQLVAFEGVTTDLDEAGYRMARKEVASLTALRNRADFTLKDLHGKVWTRSKLKGKVVLVNFWATWCPPCRKEMPDLEALYEKFSNQGLVVLAISAEEPEVVSKYVRERKFTFTILIDTAGKVNARYNILGIPNSYVYGRNGKLVAQAIDMRTHPQMLKLISKAGLR